MNSEPIVNFVMFADDTNIFVEYLNEKAVHKKANHILEKVVKYMKCNQPRVNHVICT